jgi:hypothetical protein
MEKQDTQDGQDAQPVEIGLPVRGLHIVDFDTNVFRVKGLLKLF